LIKCICKKCGKEFETYSSSIKRGRKYCSRSCALHGRNKNRIKQICKQCGKEFEVKPSIVKKGGGKYCSLDCYFKSMNEKTKCICQQCKKEFYIAPSKIKFGGGKYCSKECANKAKSIFQSGENAPGWKGGKLKRICKTCGKEFFVNLYRVKSGYGKYCSKKCFSKSMVGKPGSRPKVEMIKCICKTCGEIFFVYPSAIRKNRGKYCSRKCRNIGQSNRIKRVCKQCGKEFFIPLSKMKRRGWGKYCSKECMGKATVGENNPNWRGGNIKCVCQECGKEFYVIPATIKNGGGKFCSTECMGKAKSGERSQNWKGGTSFYPYCPKFNERRKEAVRNFFGRKCLACGANEVEFINRLPVHHVDHDKEQGCDGKPFNLVPLCIKCHGKEIWYEEEYKQYINKTLEEGFKWGIWNREEYMEKVMYVED